MYAWLADSLTLLRAPAAGLLLWLGLTRGAPALPLALLVIVLGWTTDQLDGWAARRSHTPTRLGRADFLMDLVFYSGILAYLVTARFIPALWAGLLAVAIAGVWLATRRKAVVVLGLRGIDLYGGFVLFRQEPLLGLVVVAWLAVLAAIYRRRLVRLVPRWFSDLAEVLRGHTNR